MEGRSEKRDYSFGAPQSLARVREPAGPAVADAVAALAMADMLEDGDAAALYAPWARRGTGAARIRGRRLGLTSPSAEAWPRVCSAPPGGAPTSRRPIALTGERGGHATDRHARLDSMKQSIVTLDMEGVLTPEIWIAVSEKTGIPELRRTTRDEPDYDKLMRGRLAILDQHGLKLSDIQNVSSARWRPCPARRSSSTSCVRSCRS
jgi:hypothetical protein